MSSRTRSGVEPRRLLHRLGGGSGHGGGEALTLEGLGEWLGDRPLVLDEQDPGPLIGDVHSRTDARGAGRGRIGPRGNATPRPVPSLEVAQSRPDPPDTVRAGVVGAGVPEPEWPELGMSGIIGSRPGVVLRGACRRRDRGRCRVRSSSSRDRGCHDALPRRGCRRRHPRPGCRRGERGGRSTLFRLPILHVARVVLRHLGRRRNGGRRRARPRRTGP